MRNFVIAFNIILRLLVAPSSSRISSVCSQVILVKWNEPYQKLASCDSSGVIFVWIKYDGRWSIELINDRSTPVTHFSWSHDGRMALICYRVNYSIWLGLRSNNRDFFFLTRTINIAIYTVENITELYE